MKLKVLTVTGWLPSGTEVGAAVHMTPESYGNPGHRSAGETMARHNLLHNYPDARSVEETWSEHEITDILPEDWYVLPDPDSARWTPRLGVDW